MSRRTLDIINCIHGLYREQEKEFPVEYIRIYNKILRIVGCK